MSQKTDDELVENALSSRGYIIPTFTPDEEVHECIQRAFRADLMKDGTLELRGKHGNDLWLYEPMYGGVQGKARKYVHLGHADGGNYTVFVWDYTSANPAIYRCDSVDDWNEENGEPTTGTKIAASLSSFIKSLRSERLEKAKAEKAAKKAAKKVPDPRPVEFSAPTHIAEGKSLEEAYGEELTPNQIKKLTRRVGEDLLALPDGRVATLALFHLGVLEPVTGAMTWVNLFGDTIASNVGMQMMLVGDTLVVSRRQSFDHKDPGYETYDFAYLSGEEVKIERGVTFPEGHGLMSIRSCPRSVREGLIYTTRSGPPKIYDQRLDEFRAFPDELGQVEDIAESEEHFLLGMPERESVAVVDKKMKLVAMIGTTTNVKRFGGAVAFDGDRLVIASGSGIHVFEKNGDAFTETTLTKITRNKKLSSGKILIAGDTLAALCYTRVQKIEVLKRHPKKNWQKRFMIPRPTRIALTDRHLIGGYHWSHPERETPGHPQLQIWDL